MASLRCPNLVFPPFFFIPLIHLCSTPKVTQHFPSLTVTQAEMVQFVMGLSEEQLATMPHETAAQLLEIRRQVMQAQGLRP